MLDRPALNHPAFVPPPLAQRRPLRRPPRPRRCQWIEGEPSRRDACKCGAAVAPASSYCEAHRVRALFVPFLLRLFLELRR